LIPEYFQKSGEFDQNLLTLPSFKNMAKIVKNQATQKLGNFVGGSLVASILQFETLQMNVEITLAEIK
jgi:formate/nitrite transporter FocA (FNT family)